jgi:RNA 2',3'-cyclic 3'-phosphodiesterase
VRLFVAVWPPGEVVEALAALSRPEVTGLRWVDQWHVTLRFLGDVDEDLALETFARVELSGSVLAEVGPEATVVGRRVLCLPVRGLDELAASVREATAGIGDAGPEFRGHLTLARSRGRRARLAPVLLRLEALWPVHELTLVSSALSAAGPVYQVVASRAVPG